MLINYAAALPRPLCVCESHVSRLQMISFQHHIGENTQPHSWRKLSIDLEHLPQAPAAS